MRKGRHSVSLFFYFASMIQITRQLDSTFSVHLDAITSLNDVQLVFASESLEDDLIVNATITSKNARYHNFSIEAEEMLMSSGSYVVTIYDGLFSEGNVAGEFLCVVHDANQIDGSLQQDVLEISEYQVYGEASATQSKTVGEVFGQPVSVTDGDGRVYSVAAGGSYTCLEATPKVGIFYQRVIPWDQNDSSIDGLVYWHITQGTYNYTPPTNPKYIALLPNNYSGNDTNALLFQQNAFDNYYRFTNDVGEQFVESFAESGSNTSSNPRYCIDHFTGLGWYVQDAYNDQVSRTIGDAATYVNSFSYGGYSDWRLADTAEYLNAVNYNDWTNSYNGVYAPFVDPLIRNYGGALWFGTYTKDNKFVAMDTNSSTIQLTTSTTITKDHLLMVRNHYIS